MMVMVMDRSVNDDKGCRADGECFWGSVVCWKIGQQDADPMGRWFGVGLRGGKRMGPNEERRNTKLGELRRGLGWCWSSAAAAAAAATADDAGFKVLGL